MTNLNFQLEVIDKSYAKPVLVEFWAPWCAPCKTLSTVLEKLAAEQAERWNLVEINTDEAPDLAEQYEIWTVPSVKLFYKGQPVAGFMGAYPRTAVEKWLRTFLPKKAVYQINQEPNSSKNAFEEPLC
jgi:putative thioredoxin